MTILPFNAVFSIVSYAVVDPETVQFSADILDYQYGRSVYDVMVGDIIYAKSSFSDCCKFKLTEIVAIDTENSPNITCVVKYQEGELPWDFWPTYAIIGRPMGGEIIVVPDALISGYDLILESMAHAKNNEWLGTVADITVALDEDLSDQIDGVTDTFHVKKGFYIPDSLQVTIGPVPQLQGTSFFETAPATGEFKTARPLDAEDISLVVGYRVR